MLAYCQLDKFQWNSIVFIQNNAFEIVVCQNGGHFVQKNMSWCRNWPRFCVRSRGWTRQHARVRGGASNHGSWRKNVVNFHSTTIVTIKPCNFLSRIIRSLIGIASFKSTPPSSENTSLCTRDDVTMVDECKQSTTPSSTHMEKNFQTNIFHESLKAWMDLYRSCLYPGSYLNYVFSICKAKYVNRIEESPQRSRPI